jgi:uncharacterized protein
MQRNIEVDTIRTMALIGICVVNVPFMAMPIEAQFITPAALHDQIAVFAVEALFQGKFFLLFSFIFGWGLHIQDMAAAKSGIAFGSRYARRLIGLALIGIAHALLVFTGDILVLYAILGAIIWPMRRLSPRALLRFAGIMIPVSAVALLLIAASPDGAAPIAVMGRGLGGSFAEATATRLQDWPATFFFVFLFNGPLALAAFACGLAAAKVDFFAPGSLQFENLIQKWPLIAAIGIPLNIFYAASTSGLVTDYFGLTLVLGFMGLSIGAPMLSVLYLIGIIRVARWLRPSPTMLAAGRNSLSGYVSEGIIAGFIFGGYGLGLFNSLGQAMLLGLAIAIAFLGILLEALWGKIYQRGPLESLLRIMTRGFNRAV